ncbi:amino acid ABC transporter ATP-binding protein [Leuconostoc falkenbergense]|jgi:polar amino acid transport system ATP-binding protein|uniref:Amino acid ABC transporter ATP-binding protein n=2 Tax=Leuconostoc TaxID=1243 RepID=A0A9X3E713_9LACO|nr:MULTISPECIES: amino acid ABC transporter ATP-binding protein [Leuconostoc]KDA48496.1 ABC-type polar amino acid transport system, ATPase component [Leuconostoc pseudomesenteroides 1159]KDA50585.1 ABC-type polar amino acid transport system, ATPase component [Leuconostoc pseudomesenteroides PS12]CCJ66905.1 amino acid ABC transporter, ATP-binding protein [Leuconostoc pseudomesenteroides 4882]MCT4378850.1 amino acid ABC transporter ATP-binding protein [Leuconostoc falkenbergense]MCT4388958.1 ami
MLTIKNLTKMYDQNVIFKNLNLTVKEGEVLSIVGPSGIGKTTLIKIMAGLEPANSGEITINNEAISIDGERSDANIGLIFQDFNLFPNFTVMDNITLAPINVNKVPAEKAKEQALSLLESLGMADKADLYPYQLSGGQKQRVAIARALAMSPKILAYDEPTSGLDESSTKQVAEVVKTLKSRGVTQVIITHDQFFAEIVSDRIFDFAKEVVR